MSDDKGTGTGDGKTKDNGVPWKVPLLIAVVLIAVYLVVLWLLFQAADDTAATETVWGRYIFLLAGFEAIVFTAVGWLFGREVNRKQAEKAEEAQDDAKDKAAEAAAAKAKGESLKELVLDATGGEFAPAQANSPLGLLRARAQSIEF